MIQVTDLLVTKTNQSFDNIDDWLEAHGNCGTHHEEIVEIRLILSEDGLSVKRISVFQSLEELVEFEERRSAVRRLQGLGDNDRMYQVTRIQEPEEITI